MLFNINYRHWVRCSSNCCLTLLCWLHYLAFWLSALFLAVLITAFSLEILAFYLSDSCLLTHLSSTISVHFSVDPKVIITLAVLHHKLVRAWQLILADYNQPCPHLSLSLCAVVEHLSFYISKYCVPLGVDLLSETTCTNLCTTHGFGEFMLAIAWSCKLCAHHWLEHSFGFSFSWKRYGLCALRQLCCAVMGKWLGDLIMQFWPSMLMKPLLLADVPSIVLSQLVWSET